MHGYDFRGHDFPVSEAYAADPNDKTKGKWVFAVMDDHVYQFNPVTGKTYSCGEFKETSGLTISVWESIERHYDGNEDLDEDGCKGRSSLVTVECGSDDFMDDVSRIESVKEDPKCHYNVNLKLACSKLPTEKKPEKVHKEGSQGCPHVANIMFSDTYFSPDDDDEGKSKGYLVPKSNEDTYLKNKKFKYYLEKNHIIQEDTSLNDGDLNFKVDFGFYHKTTTDILTGTIQKKFRTMSEKIVNDNTDDKVDFSKYHLTRYYSDGVEAHGCRRFSLLHLRCTEGNEKQELLTVDEIAKTDLPHNFHYETCGYIFTGRVHCNRDILSNPTDTSLQYVFPPCDNGKTCALTDGEGIFSTDCVN